MIQKPAPLLAVAIALVLAFIAAPAATAAPGTDSFYRYDGSKPLSSYSPGTVLKTRTLNYHVIGISTPLKVTQLLYRTTDALGKPSANVTSVIRSLTGDSTKAVSYQSFYDSLNPEHGPSRAIAGDVSLGGLIANAESLLIAPSLLQGYNVVIPDTEGQDANFAAGPEYGTNTLDSIRAATRAPETGMNGKTRFGLLGYSGGAIATGWAAALAPGYAPEVNKNLVGFTEGGVLVKPSHNLKYVNGSVAWTGVIPMALIGIARSFELDLKPYANSYGLQVLKDMEKASIVDAIGRYPGLTWEKFVKPEYVNPNTVLPYVEAVNKVNLGSAPTPTVPAFIAQGNNGVLEGTFGNPPGIGTGDGVMVAGDVRALARQYCETGNKSVKYDQYNTLSHVGAAVVWAPLAIGWLNDRFAGKAAPSSCGKIAPGNSLAPEVPVG
ncbi:lipase family protein [Amycolatopsis regifaucium]|uniref:Triacylglycerol lipase n=1 Tax=Amycolatopsis regifaucium TaxID=546365 RepID=A0A154MLX6_9PSEU|nr:lipase family protein [Amycolatopsis regifaucium]KZB85374.1 triacylglycerol lipase [Amycolatopsis regifaucium]OKA09019.1 triacylglycerol lipase [Amycolatopsis regifaucium]SFJ39381.1 Secretory lipase [Amycolatopsis regifaucium]